jgi:toxin ParE1/3/4
VDLGDIFDYTEQEFGSAKATSYLLELETVFNQLISSPKLGRERDEIRANLRSMVHSSHVIFYRVRTDHIRIVRVLHSSRDLSRFL